MIKYFLENELNYYYDDDIKTDGGSIYQQDLAILNLCERNHSRIIEKVFVSLDDVLHELIKLGKIFYNNNIKDDDKNHLTENIKILEKWIEENEASVKNKINYSGLYMIDLFQNIENEADIISKCEKLYIVNYIYGYYKERNFITFYNKMKKLIIDRVDMSIFISDILNFYNDENITLDKFYEDINNKKRFKEILHEEDFYAQLLLHLLILYFNFNDVNIKVCLPIYIHKKSIYHYYCSANSIYDLAAYQLLLNLTSSFESSKVKPCHNKKCHNLVEIKGNTKYCKKCRGSGIAKKLADKTYNESKKGKETRKKYYENKKNKQ